MRSAYIASLRLVGRHWDLKIIRTSLLDRYLFVQILGTFGGLLLAATVVVVFAIALREFDVITNQGAALVTFAFLTILNMPALVSVVAPIAFFLALLMVLYRLSSESEIVVVNASGGSPLSMLRPILGAALVVSLFVALLAHFVAPPAQKAWRYAIADVRGDLLATIVRAGTFSSVQDGLTFHLRAREPGGVLSDIMFADTRDYPQETIYLAETGRIVRGEEGTFLSVSNGVIQRRTESASGRITTAHLFFDTYSIDLSFADQSERPGFFKASERSTAYLLNPDPDDPFFQRRPGTVRAELHNRLAIPLYPFAYAMIMVLALGTPHSGRSGRVRRIGLAIFGGVLLLGLQFGVPIFIAAAPLVWPFTYLVPLGVVIYGWLLLTKRVSAPVSVQKLLNRFSRLRQTQTAE